MEEEFCDGCCYKKWHNGDITKCNYLSEEECLIYRQKRSNNEIQRHCGMCEKGNI